MWKRGKKKDVNTKDSDQKKENFKFKEINQKNGKNALNDRFDDREKKKVDNSKDEEQKKKIVDDSKDKVQEKKKADNSKKDGLKKGIGKGWNFGAYKCFTL